MLLNTVMTLSRETTSEWSVYYSLAHHHLLLRLKLFQSSMIIIRHYRD